MKNSISTLLAMTLITTCCYGDGFAEIEYLPQTETLSELLSSAHYDEPSAGLHESEQIAEKAYFPPSGGGSASIGTGAEMLDDVDSTGQDASPSTGKSYFPASESAPSTGKSYFPVQESSDGDAKGGVPTPVPEVTTPSAAGASPRSPNPAQPTWAETTPNEKSRPQPVTPTTEASGSGPIPNEPVKLETPAGTNGTIITPREARPNKAAP